MDVFLGLCCCFLLTAAELFGRPWQAVTEMQENIYGMNWISLGNFENWLEKAQKRPNIFNMIATHHPGLLKMK